MTDVLTTESYDRLRQNVAARRAAVELIELADGMCRDMSDGDDGGDVCKRFWLAVYVAATDRAEVSKPEPVVLPARPMDRDEAKRFGRKAYPIGTTYNGVPIDDVPIDFLNWADSEIGQFWHDLRRYLAYLATVPTEDVEPRRASDCDDG